MGWLPKPREGYTRVRLGLDWGNIEDILGFNWDIGKENGTLNLVPSSTFHRCGHYKADLH